MPGALNDTFTVGIILIFLLGAVFFYFYTRLGQVEKRMKLLETILLDLKVATESAFLGFPAPTKEPEPMETTEEENDLLAEYVPKMPISHAKPVVEDQFDEIEAEELPMIAAASAEGDTRVVELSGVAAEEHVAATEVHEEIEIHKITDNYDFQTMKELHALAKQKGLTGTSGLKRAALIETLRQKDAEAAAVAAPEPAAAAEPEAAAAEEVTAETIDEVFGQELAE